MKAIVWDDDSLGLALPRRTRFPRELLDAAEASREQMLEAVADVDEALMEKYLEGGAISESRDPRRDPQGRRCN